MLCCFTALGLCGFIANLDYFNPVIVEFKPKTCERANGILRGLTTAKIVYKLRFDNAKHGVGTGIDYHLTAQNDSFQIKVSLKDDNHGFTKPTINMLSVTNKDGKSIVLSTQSAAQFTEQEDVHYDIEQSVLDSVASVLCDRAFPDMK